MDYKPKMFRDIFEGRYVEYKSEKDKKSSMKEHLENRPHLHDMINELKNVVNGNYMSSKDNQKRKMHSMSGGSIVMIANDTDEIMRQLLAFLLHKYQIGLEQSMRGSSFIFDYLSGMNYPCNKLTISCGGSPTDSPE